MTRTAPAMPPLAPRLPAILARLGLGPGAAVVAAVSGGRDSVVLLHLLRFHAGLPLDLSAAHFDHAMRPGSAADAAWVRGLCRAWGVPLAEGRAEAPPRTEAEARAARYAFLREVQRSRGAAFLATAHHADDQAETVLFRLLRGTGLPGVAGIPERGAEGLVRPLLELPRAALAAHAAAHGLRWREDPSNARREPARNHLRHVLLPAAERAWAPAARRALAALAREARAEEEAWAAWAARETAGWAREEAGAVVLVRDRLAGYDAPLAARLLRALVGRVAPAPGRAGTRAALQFITHARSGRELRLPGGARVRTEFGLARIDRGPAGDAPPPDVPLAVPSPADGAGTAVVGGRAVRVAWRAGPASAEDDDGALRVEGARFPLAVRGWRPGDRIRTRAGTRKLKAVFAEARVARAERSRVPLVVDADGAVLWAAGLARAADRAPRPGDEALTFRIADD